jgi:molecular chaperone HscA
MLLDAVTYAKDDVSQRMVIEARTEGEQMVYTAERFVNKNGSFLNEEETTKTLALIADLKSKVSSNDKDAILNSIETLNDYTRPFAERLMDVAVSQAMRGKNIE